VDNKPASVRDDVKQWWADNPMTYGATHGVAVFVDEKGAEQRAPLGTREFYTHVDETQYRWNLPLHANGAPFGRLFPYEEFRGKQVLEVGCGMGTMAMLWAQHGAKVTACDLNPVAVQQTTERFRLFGLEGRVMEADGGKLPFPDHSFDYVYSWGVLHHSPSLDVSIGELLRVLKPSGKYGVMLYHRRSFRTLYLMRYVEGFLHRENHFLSPLELTSRYSDGGVEEGNPHTWPVTKTEMFDLFSKHADQVKILVFGDKEVRNNFKLLMPILWRWVPDRVVRAWARRLGWSLWIYGTKGRQYDSSVD